MTTTIISVVSTWMFLLAYSTTLLWCCTHHHHPVLAFATTSTTTTSAAQARSFGSSSFTRSAFTKRPTFGVPRGGGGGGNNGSKDPPSWTALDASASSSSTTTTEEVISKENWNLLSDAGAVALKRLIAFDTNEGEGAQRHVYADWPPAGQDDEGKQRLANQLADLEASYPGGLPAYLRKARKLLQDSAEGVNPFDEYTAQIPQGEMLDYCDAHSDSSTTTTTMSYAEAEQAGYKACKGLVFCLVAGGLGERLGYSGIKLSLETDLVTQQSYLEHYIRFIEALEYHCNQQPGNKGQQVRIPLVIMTSGDTDPLTRNMLQDHDYFGRDPSLVPIVTQDKVAALKDQKAGLALDDRWTVQTKPHGHGDVHHLLYKSGLVDQWVERDAKTHLVFLQDTNALVIHAVLATLGVSVLKGFHMNSICIPRLAGEAAGAIAALEHKTDPSKSLVINVEYNQLDPLLRSQGDGLGDVADPKTGYSPYPGNANNLILELNAYSRTLRGEDEGVVLEFVNPKYKDEKKRDEFKKPTRLECMMQDIPKLFQKEMGQDAKIGFTQFDRWFTFSPAKNSLEAGQDSVRKGSTAPGTMSSAESDLYTCHQRKLQAAGVNVPVHTPEEDGISVAGIPVTPGPRIVVDPSFAITREQLQEKLQKGGSIQISKKSSLFLNGPNIAIEGGLKLDGAMIVRAIPEAHVTVQDGLTIQNKGWEFQELDPTKDYPEHVRIRGYTLTKHETAEYIFDEPGEYVIQASGDVVKKS